MKKDMSFYKKLVISYIISNVLFIIMFVGAIAALKGSISSDNPMAYYKQFLGFAIVLGILTAVVQIYAAVSNSKYIRVFSGQLKGAANALILGKTDIEIHKVAEDEFGEIADAMMDLAAASKEQAEVASAVANGDLTVKITPRSKEDLLGNSLKTLIDSNLRALSDINQGAFQVMTSASQVASASESLAQGSTEQASAIEEVTASIAEVAEKTKQNANEANRAANLISKVNEDVKVGNREMSEMLSAMEDINKSSESISKIIKVIDDIAFQTNILALNAAVEAARAGDAGKGFAVVAEEVRNLAAKSAQAAAETAELIEDSIDKVNSGSKIAGDTYKSLEVITEVVTESESLISGIAESSNYQATAVAQINQAVGQISQVVQTNSATSEECAAASDELSSQAARMKELLAVYNLGKGNSSFGSASYSKKQPSKVNNEKIISLGEEFGKY